MKEADTKNAHVISGDLDILLGEAKYLPWSCSRMETAGTCLYKFHQVYLGGVKEHSPALTLGGLSHEVIAELLKVPEPSTTVAHIILSQAYRAFKALDPDGYAWEAVQGFIPYMVTFCRKWKNFCKDNNITKYRIEHPYGLTDNLTRASYIPQSFRQTYFRGIIDLWGYDPVTQTIYVVDHKTNKSAVSQKKVKECIQLNLYVGMLSRIYKMPWKKAVIGLNFLRKNKVVWATVTPEENADFMDKFLNTLHYLESRLFTCESEMVWPTEKSFKCKWCAFRGECVAFQDTELPQPTESRLT